MSYSSDNRFLPLVARLGSNLRSVVDASEIRNLAKILLRLRQHALVCQEQDVFRVGLGCLPPLEDMIEPRSTFTP